MYRAPPAPVLATRDSQYWYRVLRVPHSHRAATADRDGLRKSIAFRAVTIFAHRCRLSIVSQPSRYLDGARQTISSRRNLMSVGRYVVPLGLLTKYPDEIVDILRLGAL